MKISLGIHGIRVRNGSVLQKGEPQIVNAALEMKNEYEASKKYKRISIKVFYHKNNYTFLKTGQKPYSV